MAANCTALHPDQATKAALDAADSEEFLGSVKSYNARRGFGFVACAQTAAKFGRDVYIAKAEAQLAFAGDSHPPGSTQQLLTPPADKGIPLAFSEEDLIRFKVRLSVEGYPQAEQIHKVRKFLGIVVNPLPAEECDSDGKACEGRIVSDEMRLAFGKHAAILRRVHCGQARLVAGGRVTFCALDAADAELPEALLVVHIPRRDPVRGGILGCFLVSMPRAPVSVAAAWSYQGRSTRIQSTPREDMQLQCHALHDRIVVSGLPRDADEEELMNFFSKHGAVGAPVVHCDSGSFASIHFSTPADISRFIASSTHAFADDKELRVVRLHPCRSAASGPTCMPGLPGLPPPVVAFGEQPGVLLVSWQPVLLASGYIVELRPAGREGPWSKVDASNGRLGGSAAHRFDIDCQGCRIVGLAPNIAFEARISYTTACGCTSCTSMPSESCRLVPQPAGTLGLMQLSTTPGLSTKVGWPQAWSSAVQPQPFAASCRCIHGSVLPPPPTPKVEAADEGLAVLVQWTCAPHAAAYVVELRESGSQHAERFLRSLSTEAAGSIAELRVGGLCVQPGSCSRYVAQVRAVSACGCESEPSAAAVSPPIGADTWMPKPEGVNAIAGFASQQVPEVPDSPSATTSGQLPSLLSSRPSATPTGTEASDKVLPHPETLNMEDCIILD